MFALISVTSCSDKRENDYADFYKDTGVDPRLDESVYNINETDQQFIIDAAQVNLDEIDLGMLAQDNGTAPEIKALGKMMKEEHFRSLKELQGIAIKKNIQLPTSVSGDEMGHYQRLSWKTGVDFDKDYSNIMVQGHRETIEKFERESASISDPDLKKFVLATLPVLKKHLEHSLKCRENLIKPNR